MSIDKDVVFEPIVGEFPPDRLDELHQAMYKLLIQPDLDLFGMHKEDLILEALRLRKALRSLRDRTGHALCWYNPEIWSVLPEKIQPHPTLPCQPEFLHNCEKFWQEQNNANIQRTGS